MQYVIIQHTWSRVLPSGFDEKSARGKFHERTVEEFVPFEMELQVSRCVYPKEA